MCRAPLTGILLTPTIVAIYYDGLNDPFRHLPRLALPAIVKGTKGRFLGLLNLGRYCYKMKLNKFSLFAALVCASESLAYDNYHYERLFENGVCSECDLTEAPLEGFDLQFKNHWGDPMRLDFRIADLTGAHLREAKLAWANFDGAKLLYADLSDADLTGAVLVDANLTGANLTNANLTGAILSGTDFAGDSMSWQDGKISSGANLTGANLTGANLEETGLTNIGTVAVGIAFEDEEFAANLTGASLVARDHLENIIVRDLTGIRLAGANLTNANLSMVDLSGVDMTNANLTGANLSGAILNGTRFTIANLTNANMTGAIWLEARDLENAIMCNTTAPDGSIVNDNC